MSNDVKFGCVYRNAKVKLFIFKDDVLLKWINPMYLSPDIVKSIQEQLEENSEIQLDEFLIVSMVITTFFFCCLL